MINKKQDWCQIKKDWNDKGKRLGITVLIGIFRNSFNCEKKRAPPPQRLSLKVF
ncbi:hypothetical protein V4D30_04870 [Thermodesulfovibrio sp. 3907-1M]|uniref:Transposase n=1 Tax=Thermodesulfovibrio autotrophicus TaxID=3118333 RepID=A0AAU8H2A7_9BACT